MKIWILIALIYSFSCRSMELDLPNREADIIYAIKLGSLENVKRITHLNDFDINREIFFNGYSTSPLHEAVVEAGIALRYYVHYCF